uniref:Uncharacterized protein n=1 Tax=Meloidogyne floridensis TaxID=298350 RepID=A0A915NFB8_9BILA
MKSVFKLNFNFKKVITQEAMEFDDFGDLFGEKVLEMEEKDYEKDVEKDEDAKRRAINWLNLVTKTTTIWVNTWTP